MGMKEEKDKMKTSLHGNNNGYAYLRLLIIICCILLCFSSVINLLFTINNSSKLLAEETLKYIDAMNKIEYEAVYEK